MPSSGLGGFASKSRKLAAEHSEKLRSLVQGTVWEVDSLGTVYPMAVGRPLEPNIEQRQKPPTVS